jgi:nicotinamide-nucleotide amidase
MEQQLSSLPAIAEYLKEKSLLLSTAESCTAGQMIALLASVPGAGALLESGYVVYSPEAKQRILHVNAQTIETYGLTSEEVALEMARGAIEGGPANVAIATTGVAGPDPVDGIEPGTVCIAWIFHDQSSPAFFTQTEKFSGGRLEVQIAASLHALTMVPRFHAQVLAAARHEC